MVYQTCVGYFMPKPSLSKNNNGIIQPIAGGISGSMPFPNICPKVLIKAWL